MPLHCRRPITRCAATATVTLVLLGMSACGGGARATLPGGGPAGTPAGQADSPAASAAASATGPAGSSGGGPGSLPGGAGWPGGGSPTGARVARPDVQELLTQATTRAKTATSVVLEAEGVQSGSGSQLRLDLRGRLDGRNMKLTMWEQGQVTEILIVGERSWIRYGEGGTTASPGTVGRSGYLEAPRGEVDAARQGMSPGALLQHFTAPQKMSALQKANVAMDDVTEQSRPAWLLHPRVGDRVGVTIAADGAPDLLKVDSGDQGRVTMSHWNDVPPFSSPAPAELTQP